MAFVHGVIGARGEKDGRTCRHKLTNRRRLDDHKFRITLPSFLRLPFRLPLILGIPRENLPCHRGRQKFRGKCLHPRARGPRFSLIAFFCTLWRYEVTDCRSETYLVVGVVTRKVGTGYTERGIERESVGSRQRRRKFFLVSFVRAGRLS